MITYSYYRDVINLTFQLLIFQSLKSLRADHIKWGVGFYFYDTQILVLA
jgi:hypothetical protein